MYRAFLYTAGKRKGMEIKLKIKAKTEIIKLIKIRGYNEFCCTGPKCIDNCCHGANWRIDIEQKLYNKYERLDNEIGRKIVTHIIKNPVTEKYQIALNKKNICPFNGEDKLCEIYKELGEGYMGIVCRVYPRIINRYNYSYEYSLTLSCPEAVNLLIMNETPISFVNEYVKKSDMPLKLRPQNVTVKTGLTGENCIKIRDFSILILQQRSLTLWQRIAYLGIFSKSIDALNSGNSISKELDGTIIKYSDNLYSEEIISSLNKMKLSESGIRNKLLMALAELLPILFSHLELDASGNKAFNDNVLDVFINISSNNPTYLNPDTIGELKSQLLNPYIAGNEHIFENYLVTEIFNFSYPALQTSVYSAYASLVVKFILLELFVIIVHHKNESITDENIADSIYYFSKMMDHNKNKITVMEYLTKESPALSLANLVSMVMYSSL